MKTSLGIYADVQRDDGSKVGLRRAVIAFLVQMNTGRLAGEPQRFGLGPQFPALCEQSRGEFSIRVRGFVPWVGPAVDPS